MPSELIDTLWNVNVADTVSNDGDFKELIDTLWNVNLVGVGAASVGVARINRYIMECKYAFAATNDAGGEN